MLLLLQSILKIVNNVPNIGNFVRFNVKITKTMPLFGKNLLLLDLVLKSFSKHQADIKQQSFDRGSQIQRHKSQQQSVNKQIFSMVLVC